MSRSLALTAERAAQPREPQRWTVFESPLGPLTLTAGERGLSSLRFPGRGGALAEQDRDPAPFADAAEQLEEYFAGRRQRFELPLDAGGTSFQRRVWNELRTIPYGTTLTYTQLARLLGGPDLVRAVAGGVARTPIPIIVPCHRVLAEDGGLTGYLGGLHRKQALLDLERDTAAGRPPRPAWAFRQLGLLG